MKRTIRKTRIELPVTDQDVPALFGLVSSDPDYKLSLKLNLKLNTSLKSSASVVIKESDGPEVKFSRFSDNSRSPGTVINLISNRSGKIFLLKSLRNIDYLLLVHDTENNFAQSRIPEIIRELDNVTAVFSIDFMTMKDKNTRYIL